MTIEKIKVGSTEHDLTASSCTGNAATATKLATARTISLTGDVTGSASFNGSANASITATVADNSHNHAASNITSGTLAVDRGGTGAATAAAARTALGITPANIGAAASSHTHSYLPLSGGSLSGNVTFTKSYGGIYATDFSTDEDGVIKEVFVGQTPEGNTSIGYGNYETESGMTNVYGDSITMTSRTAGLFQREYGVNKILWQGNLHMNANQTITLLDTVFHQPNGIALVWSEYDNSTQTPFNQGFVTHFIPKILVALQPDRFHAFDITPWSTPSSHFSKGLYISDEDITGHSINTSTTSSAAVNSYVLRYVIGV